MNYRWQQVTCSKYLRFFAPLRDKNSIHIEKLVQLLTRFSQKNYTVST